MKVNLRYSISKQIKYYPTKIYYLMLIINYALLFITKRNIPKSLKKSRKNRNYFKAFKKVISRLRVKYAISRI